MTDAEQVPVVDELVDSLECYLDLHRDGCVAGDDAVTLYDNAKLVVAKAKERTLATKSIVAEAPSGFRYKGRGSDGEQVYEYRKPLPHPSYTEPAELIIRLYVYNPPDPAYKSKHHVEVVLSYAGSLRLVLDSPVADSQVIEPLLHGAARASLVQIFCPLGEKGCDLETVD